MRCVCWAVIALCLLAGTAAARDIYVDNLGGDDGNNGRSAHSHGGAGGAVRTIAKAVRLASGGDHIILAKSGQPYHECVSLVGAHCSGAAPLMPFILDGKGAKLDGSAAIPDDRWAHFRDNIFRFQIPAPIGAVLFYRGRAIPPRPLPRTAAVPPRLKPLEWCALQGAIYFAVEPSRLPRDYKLSYAELPTGITLYGVRQVVIRNLVIEGFQADGVAAAAGSRDIVLENVFSMANGQSGVCVQGGAQAALENCSLAGNGQAQLLTLANSETHLLSSTLAGDTARGWIDRGGRVYLGAKRIEGGRKEIKPE